MDHKVCFIRLSYNFDINNFDISLHVQANDAGDIEIHEPLAADYLLSIRIWESAGTSVGEASPEFADSHSGSGGNLSVILVENKYLKITSG